MANSEPHSEGGGDEDAIVFFSNRNVGGPLYEFGSGFIVLLRDTAIIPQFGFHAPFRCLVAQLQAKILVKPIDPFGVYRPAIPTQQHMNASVAVAHPRLGNLLHPLSDIRLAAASGFVDIKRPVDL